MATLIIDLALGIFLLHRQRGGAADSAASTIATVLFWTALLAQVAPR